MKIELIKIEGSHRYGNDAKRAEKLACGIALLSYSHQLVAAGAIQNEETYLHRIMGDLGVDLKHVCAYSENDGSYQIQLPAVKGHGIMFLTVAADDSCSLVFHVARSMQFCGGLRVSFALENAHVTTHCKALIRKWRKETPSCSITRHPLNFLRTPGTGQPALK